jgi:GDP-L-fucose synthase
MEKSARIFVAGHRGLVGSAIARALSSAGHDRLLLRTHRELDLSRQTDVEKFFEHERPEYVFLAAARVGGILANDTRPADFIRDNLVIQTNVIDASLRFGVKKLLFLGSSCIYPKHAPQPIREDSLLTGPLEPTNEWYAVAKIAGIRMCQAYARQHGFRAISLMPINLYGLGDNYDLQGSHVLPALIRKFHLGALALSGDFAAIAANADCYGPIPEDILNALYAIAESRGHMPPAPPRAGTRPAVLLWGTGAARREFLHADDLANACLFLMEHYESPEIINVGVGEDLAIRELAETVQRIAGYCGPVEWDSGKPDGTPRKLLDVSRLSAQGWRAQIPLEAGIRHAYEWYLDNAARHAAGKGAA